MNVNVHGCIDTNRIDTDNTSTISSVELRTALEQIDMEQDEIESACQSWSHAVPWIRVCSAAVGVAQRGGLVWTVFLVQCSSHSAG